MKLFAELFRRLDQTTKTNEKVAAIAAYMSAAAPEDAGWAIAALSGRRVKRLVSTGLLRRLAAEQAGVPDWLFEESYDAVGDLAETITLLVPAGNSSAADSRSLSEWMHEKVLPLSRMDESQQSDAVRQMWAETRGTSRLILMKLITGAFRVGVSSRLVARGIAESNGLPADVIAHRLMGDWSPTPEFVQKLHSPDLDDALHSRPYPFCLAHALADDANETGDAPDWSALGDPADYQADWKWDGIRGQVIRRAGRTYIWSRGEDLMVDRWPEIERAAEFLPDGTVLDGEILASRFATTDASSPSIEVLPFAQLQRRIGRKTVGKKLLTEVPVMFHAFDCIEANGLDLREQPLFERREQLQSILAKHQPPSMVWNEPLSFSSWQGLADLRSQSRDVLAEGVMIKRLDAPYSVGRTRGVWWKWKLAPHTVDAVLIYAQRGHGKRASLYTDYTFAVWDGDKLVPFAKAYSGLTDAEIQKVDRFVRDNTSERFGPVRSVQPELVMELAFEGLQRSTRHKSGIATRFPRIVRWRTDKKPEDADRLSDLLAMLPDPEPKSISVKNESASPRNI
ncbi:ATP-dependent DNA ligase [Rhodopirellula halodulae]|uniref:ATP-dependent DNA ligase n=1 Tax=Rhodopirellula halodulae TaxID=2894198 RepID=UPI001E541A09|nr:ATP-dependent DNA ligase [Rhodopirellula sp. JC737]MCC9656556.1 ATP-dependent DNA ligase [Rhodopirellula sp. JC737]